MDLRSLQMIVPFQPFKFHRIKERNKNSNTYFEIRNDKNYKRGIVTIDGKEIIPIGYERMQWINHDKAIICIIKNGKTGVVDLNSNIVIPFKYDDIGVFVDDQSIVNIDDKYGVININNELITPVIYETIKGLGEGKRRMEKDGQWRFLDQTSQVSIEANYEYVEPFKSGLSIVKANGLFGVINHQNQLEIPAIYKKLSFQYKRNVVDKCKVTLDGQKFIIDLKGRCVENCPDEAFLQKYKIKK